ncbi:flavin-containing monooxygenase [Stella sp.]|uniref:flavin-containing monooxygenase n=1 Tax=Stella sp. TaxID=2912054 RepID=UPI0035B1F14A
MSEAGSDREPELDVVIVGAGLGGLYALHRMRAIGMTARVYEAGGGIGGTWFWNRYPGARCDIESLEYSYAFDDALQQEWKWPERYGAQPDILRYIEHVADRFDLRRDVRLDARIATAVYDRDANRWTLTTADGEAVTARFCIMATGNLSTPRVPDFPGLERFRGRWYHSGLWPAEGVDFTGLRVGVVGTGSTAIQMIPLIAQQARHLHVFQRTANFSLPARNQPMDPEFERAFKAEYRRRREEAKRTPVGVSGFLAPTRSALAIPAEERERRYEELWQQGGTIGFLTSFKDFLLDEAANETAAEFVRRKIRSIVRDPAVAELLAPKDHPIGSKRLCLDTGYYETYNRDNVTLVDVRSAPIREITETGIRTAAAEYELDAMAFATGFDAMTGALREIDIRVAGGPALSEVWKAGPRTYLGLTIPGFPNFFVITGPGSPGVKSQMIHSIEQHTDWIADCLVHLRGRQLARIEPEPAASDAWVAHVNAVADATLYPRADSWYMGANIPGKPRVFMPYVGGVGAYRAKCEEVAADNYRGFALSR